jgi:tRNA(Ile)-lysidine synthase
MQDRVENGVRRLKLLRPGDRIGVAVSGGADSVFLLHMLLKLSETWDWKLTVLHANHELRGEESEKDMQFVQKLAGSLDLPCIAERVPVPAGNLEQSARDGRLAFFARARAGGLDWVATGHTRSDQAETVLFRFLRGSGTSGFAGIRPVTSDGLIRPLLDIGREEIRAYLQQNGIPWREDKSNLSLDFDRNRIRHELLPQLSRDWNPSIEQTLARMAAWAVDEEAFWDAQIALPERDRTGAIILNSNELAREHPALSRRLIRAAIGKIKGGLRGVGFQHVDRILEMATSAQGHDRFQLGGVDALKSFEWIRIAPWAPGAGEFRNFCYAVSVPSIVDIPGGQPSLHLELIEPFASGDCVYNSGVGVLDWDRLTEPLSLRNWRPGDVYLPNGYTASRKLKDLFQEARVPLWDRRSWPVLEMGETIVWSRRFGPASAFAARPQSRKVLVIREDVQSTASSGGTEVSQCSRV